MNLVLVAPDELDAQGFVHLHGRRAEHLVRVLGAARGTRLRVGVVRGATGIGEVVRNESGAVTVAVRLEGTAPPPPSVSLVLGLPRPKALSRLLGAVASMGVARIDIVNAWRVDKSYFDSPRLDAGTLAEAIWLGCEQGMTTWLPEVAVFRRFTDLLPRLAASPAGGCRLVAHPRASRLLEGAPTAALDVPTVLALGPDGGWIDGEVAALAEQGFVPVSLGPWVLRTEIAAPIALAELALLRRLRSAREGASPPFEARFD
ncbi:MAG: 16S rRNA (uracil(1498)-N(3))-methyltransferase [Polyangiaceae bacterium]|nr:16S rRNA (uracil(1498)-N(3))-methyltransferase [Polyangiaceae bacterium]